jgi:hypothetical protein
VSGHTLVVVSDPVEAPTATHCCQCFCCAQACQICEHALPCISVPDVSKVSPTAVSIMPLKTPVTTSSKQDQAIVHCKDRLHVHLTNNTPLDLQHSDDDDACAFGVLPQAPLGTPPPRSKSLLIQGTLTVQSVSGLQVAGSEPTWLCYQKRCCP